MQEFLSFSLNQSDNLTESVDKLRELLSHLGASVNLSEYPSSSKAQSSYIFMSITYDSQTVKKKVTRGAGPKRGRNQNPKNLTWGEVMKLRESHTAKEVAEMLGISRDTFYKRIRKRSEFSEDSDLFR